MAVTSCGHTPHSYRPNRSGCNLLPVGDFISYSEYRPSSMAFAFRPRAGVRRCEQPYCAISATLTDVPVERRSALAVLAVGF